MTHISSDDVRQLARLSNLQLTGDELTSLEADLSNILDYIEQLNELDTDGVEPTYQVTGLHNVWRHDEVGRPTVTKEKLLALAPFAENDQVKVPKVL